MKRLPMCMRCGATTRAADRHPCQKWAMKNGRCMFHGGKSLVGVEAPRFKHGRYSILLPHNLAERVYQVSPDLRPRRRRARLASTDVPVDTAEEMGYRLVPGDSGGRPGR